MSQISLPVSIGEALDKYSILSIKLSQITDHAKLNDVINEMTAIQSITASALEKYSYQYRCLYNINQEIWNLTDEVRKEGLSPEDRYKIFIEIFLKNEARFRIKSKLNKLCSSNLKEQKNNSVSTISLHGSTIESYEERNGYIRYLSLCYDVVALHCPEDCIAKVKNLFSDDPNIHVVGGAAHGSSITQTNEPIPNLLSKYDFKNIGSLPDLTYICGGRLGDFIHALYTVKCKYIQTGRKGRVYINETFKLGGHEFAFPLKKTYAELVDIVGKQPYISSFSIDDGSVKTFDVNLNQFRQSHNLFRESWLEIFSNTFSVPLMTEPWLIIPKNEEYKDLVVIHRSANYERYVPGFLEFLEKIIHHNKCVFVTTNTDEYEAFPFKKDVPLHLKSNLYELTVAINSCKFFIGNQSSPLAIAYALGKPHLCESSSGGFYASKKHFKGCNWFAQGNIQIDNLSDYVVYQVNYPFYAQFNTDEYIAKYFPNKYRGTCIDVGMAEPIYGNNSYHFEQMGWKCLCVEPNPNYYNMGLKVRKTVENLACGDKDADNVIFEIFTVNGSNQGAISSLKRDDRLVESHAGIINNVQRIPVKVRTLNSILALHPEITEIDFVSIDTENTELDVLKGFDIEKWKPKLFVIENNFDEPFLGEYLKQFGYVKNERLAVNDFYVQLSDKVEYPQFHGESQQGKRVDQSLREYFPDYSYKGVFFDVGAYEPINISNSYHFEKNGWDVHCFEANTQRISELKLLRKNVYNYAVYDSDAEAVNFNVVHGPWGGGSLTAAISAVELDPRYMKDFGSAIKSIDKITVPQRTLNTLIDTEVKINHIDILSIDVAGAELHVLKGLNLEKYKPKVILVEDFFGNKDLHDYFVQHNYRLDKAVLYNKYYVPTN